MTDRGEPNPRQLFENMTAFAKLGVSGGINNFCLVGAVNVPTLFEDFIGVFPKTDPREPRGYAFISTRTQNPQEVYTRILRLDLPQRIVRLRTIEDSTIRKMLELRSARNGMPSIMISLGKARDTGEDVIVLFCVAGISPQKAIKEMKREIRTRLYKSN